MYPRLNQNDQTRGHEPSAQTKYNQIRIQVQITSTTIITTSIISRHHHHPSHCGGGSRLPRHQTTKRTLKIKLNNKNIHSLCHLTRPKHQITKTLTESTESRPKRDQEERPHEFYSKNLNKNIFIKRF